MDHPRGRVFHSFSERLKIRWSSLEAASPLGKCPLARAARVSLEFSPPLLEQRAVGHFRMSCLEFYLNRRVDAGLQMSSAQGGIHVHDFASGPSGSRFRPSGSAPEKLGKQLPFLSLGVRSLTVPARVRQSRSAVAIALRQPLGALLAIAGPDGRAHLQLHQPLGGKADHLAEDIDAGGHLTESKCLFGVWRET